MKKQTLILALMLVITFSVSIFAEGETHGTGGETHGTGGGITEAICQICDALTGNLHP